MKLLTGRGADLDPKLIDCLSYPEDCYADFDPSLSYSEDYYDEDLHKPFSCSESKRTVDPRFLESEKMELVQSQYPRPL